ncbi:MAG: hypothetical protein ATN35_07325 [Epulopiscium sp. Nele67-Bin004]|nr:MAG: hypothetical protein ATN35_07325 [Epulopiscium sp. Nele67-Bin004]
MLKYLCKSKPQTIFYLIITPVAAIAEIGLAYILQMILDTALAGDMQLFKNVTIISILYVLTNTAINYVYKIERRKIVNTATVSLKDDITAAISKKSYINYSQKAPSEYSNMLLNDVPQLEVNFFDTITTWHYDTFSLIIALYALTTIDPLVAIIVLCCGLTQLVIPQLMGKKASVLLDKQSDKNKEYISNVKDLFQGFEVFKTFKGENAMRERHHTSNNNLEKARLTNKTYGATVVTVSYIIDWLSQIIVLVIVAYLVAIGRTTAGSILVASQLMNTISCPLTSLASDILAIKSTKGLRDKLLVVLSESHEEKPLFVEEMTKEIKISNVSVTKDNNNILKGVSLTLQKGGKYIFVGASGSGKSTLLNALSGLIDYDGDISIDNNNVNDISNIYNVVGLNKQNPHIFNDTVRNNITVYSDYEEQEILKYVQQFEISLQDGLDTMLDENLQSLSGGEKQRIAIIRTLLQNKEVILYDESTSQLDNVLAFEVENMLINRPNTTIMILHRLNPMILEQATEIIVMDNGEIKDKGTFAYLSENSEYFKKLIE